VTNVRGDFDLELFESRTLDGHTQELVYARTSSRADAVGPMCPLG
jgi:hypothetical protein